jgi:hypothetical protein
MFRSASIIVFRVFEASRFCGFAANESDLFEGSDFPFPLFLEDVGGIEISSLEFSNASIKIQRKDTDGLFH